MKILLTSVLLLLTLSGYTQEVIEYHANKTKAAEGMLVNGKKEGYWKYWNEQGRLVSSQTYQHDTLHGLTLHYDDYGMLQTSEKHERGVLVSFTTYYHNAPVTETYYYPNGQKKSETKHEAGLKVVSTWDGQGTLVKTDTLKKPPRQVKQVQHGDVATAGDAVDSYSTDPPRPNNVDSTYIYEMPEEMAEFPGGKEALVKYLQQNISYPDEQSKKYQGKIYIKFVVNTNGSIQDVKIIRSLYGSLNNEVIRLVKEMPRWRPAKVKGKTVRSYMVIPVAFN